MREHDLKLLSIGISLWLGAAVAGLLPLLLIPILILVFHNRARFFVLIIFAGAAISGLHQYALENNYLKPYVLNHEKVHLIAEVDSDPHLSQSRVVGSYLKNRSTTFLAQSISVDSVKVRLPLRMSFTGPFKEQIGSVFECEAELIPSNERKVAALAIVHGNYKRIHGSSRLQSATDHIRGSFSKVVLRFKGDGASLIPGLVLGDTSLQSYLFTSQMRQVGLTHLTAVSGENFAIISAFFLFLMRFIFKRLEMRLLSTGAALIIFIVLVRPSPSVLRAAVMTGVLLFSHLRGERHSALPALGFALTLLVLIDPFQAIDPGFVLSVSATAGILLLRSKLTFPDFLAIPIAATLFTLPVIVALSGQLSLFSIPANLMASVAVGPITITGFLAALLSPFLPSLSFWIIAGILPFAEWIAFVAHFGSHFPRLQLPNSYFGAILILTVLIVAFKRTWLVFVIICTLIAGHHIYSSVTWPGEWWIVQCNVGQGDAEAINLGHGRALVIDVGPDPDAIDTCLKRIGIKEIPLLVLTHPHADHVNGLSGAMRSRKVGTIWRSEIAGDSFQLGEIRLDVLWPDKDEQLIAPYARTGSEINNTSIALMITYHGHRFFTGGDIEPAAQNALLSGGIEAVDVMKVCHHGSSHQSQALTQKLKPRIAFISVGKDNPYGHPSQQTISYFEALGSKVYRTDVDGDIAIDAELNVRTHAGEYFTFR